jgi:translation initiation factor 2B subunit (eIF-2B alpha/beta/delta family)
MELLLDRKTLPFYSQDLFAKTGIMALYNSALSEDPFKNLFMTREVLMREPNVVLSNASTFFLHNLTSEIKEQVHTKKDEALSQIGSMNVQLADNAAKKIQPGATVFVHSINNHIVDILNKAKETKRFSLHILEHRPLNYGNILSKKLAGIDIKVFPDIAAREAIENTDICFLGAEALTEHGAVCKAGSNMVADMSRRCSTPVYVCAHSWKYDSKGIYQRLLEQQHEGSRVFEFLNNDNFHSYALDIGVVGQKHVVREIRSFNKWM